ncbi:MAG: hypothetical protein M1371_03975 [Actinobacteria bacterium]|nr:hypothetical protein [Actinomycetota bacterium]
MNDQTENPFSQYLVNFRGSYRRIKNELDEQSKADKEKFDKFGSEILYARKISRNTLFRIIIFSASIIGFSATIFSIPIIQPSLKLNILQYSWYIFLAEIVLGFLILMLEGRIKFAITWKNFQLSKYGYPYKYSNKDNLIAFFIALLSLLHPANLIFNKAYENAKEKEFKQRVNGLVVIKLADWLHRLIIFENLFFILFVCGLVLLVLSFKISK